MNERIVRFGVSIPRDLLERFDRFIEDAGYANRSEAIRFAMKTVMWQFNMEKSGGEAIGVIAVLFDHDVKGCQEEITSVQHKFTGTVLGSSHIHLGKLCLETIVCRGIIKSLTRLYKRIGSIRGVEATKLIILPTGD